MADFESFWKKREADQLSEDIVDVLPESERNHPLSNWSNPTWTTTFEEWVEKFEAEDDFWNKIGMLDSIFRFSQIFVGAILTNKQQEVVLYLLRLAEGFSSVSHHNMPGDKRLKNGWGPHVLGYTSGIGFQPKTVDNTQCLGEFRQAVSWKAFEVLCAGFFSEIERSGNDGRICGDAYRLIRKHPEVEAAVFHFFRHRPDGDFRNKPLSPRDGDEHWTTTAVREFFLGLCSLHWDKDPKRRVFPNRRQEFIRILYALRKTELFINQKEQFSLSSEDLDFFEKIIQGYNGGVPINELLEKNEAARVCLILQGIRASEKRKLRKQK